MVNFPKQFLSTQGWVHIKKKTLFIACSQEDWQGIFDEFKRSLGGGEPFLIPGGPSFFLLENDPLRGECARGSLRLVDFLIQGHGLGNIVCVSHKECVWDSDVWPGITEEAQIENLRQIGWKARAHFPFASVHLYYAAYEMFGGERKVLFTKIN